VLTLIVAVAFGAWLGSGGDGNGGRQEPPPATEPPSPEKTTPSAPQEETSPNRTTPTPKPPPDPAEEEARERRDLVSFAINDRSVSGFESIWITWTIENHSSKKSDYRWAWEAIDANGVRVDDGTQYESNVQPGQTTKGDFPTTLDTANVKLNVTDFDRSASW
jgi:hypothetical protein